MKNEIATSSDNIASVAAYLANNIEFVAKDLNPSGFGVFSQCANQITIMLLPHYQRGKTVNFEIETGSALAELTLLKMMHLQSIEISNHVRKKDGYLADWMLGCFTDFIKKAAVKYAERQSQKQIAEQFS